LDGKLPPPQIHAETEQVIEQVITGGDGAEHLSDGVALPPQ
jgi:hypothetical protein